MAIEPVAAASPRIVLAPDAVAAVAPPGTTREQTASDRPTPRLSTSRAHRVEISFHDDLRALMTRVLDSQTGELLSEYPARQVLDTVADLLRTMHAKEEV